MADIQTAKRFITLKRELFRKYYAHLNDRQIDAVCAVNGPLLILAGAGSGKTTVLVHRVSHILRYGNAYESPLAPADVSEETLSEMEAAKSLPREELGEYLTRFAVNPPPPWSVLAITFTNKAAGEIKTRLSAQLGEDSDAAKEVWSGTFHSVCMRLLRRWGDRIGYAPGFGVCDADDSKKLIAAVMKELNVDEKQLPVKSVANAIGRAKDTLLSPDDFAAEAGDDFRRKQIARIYTVYQERLRSANLLDFDDIIMQTVLLMERDEEARDRIQSQFRYVLVDEYQDTNRAQLRLTLLLSGKYRNVMVVGDDDQSIYRFRGATIENILNFEKDMENARVVKLEQNYRSTQTILDAANAVIAKNQTRHRKELWTAGDKGEKIVCCRQQTQNEEARFIADEVARLVTHGRRYRDFAVLYRTNAQSRTLEQILSRASIPHRLLGGVRFFDRTEVRDLIAYLCVLNNPLDDVRLHRIVNVPRRGIGNKSLSAAEALAAAEGKSLLAVFRTAKDYTAIPSAAAKSMMELAALIDELRETAATSSVAELLRKVIDVTGYGQMLAMQGETEQERIDNIGELVSTAAEYDESETEEEHSLSGYLENVALVSDVDKYDEEADAVVLMTIHSAKGLEFPVVFLPGLEEGLFPGSQTIAEGDEALEEERRLAYVALTRAREKLYLIYTYERMLNGQTSFNPPSRFLRQIPRGLLDVQGEPSRDGCSGARTVITDRPQDRPRVTDRRPYSRQTPVSTEVFSVGDRVHHTIFGDGTILSSTPMGGDTIYEIVFDRVGTKKLMATHARLQRA